jgi:mRNA interferase MazF
MGYEIGDVVVVRFPFTSQEAAKQRPAAVISSAAYNSNRPDIVLLAITSQIRSPLGFGEALIKDWQAAGLLKPSVFKPILFTIEQTLVRKVLGRLSVRDQQAMEQLLDRVLR